MLCQSCRSDMSRDTKAAPFVGLFPKSFLTSGRATRGFRVLRGSLSFDSALQNARPLFLCSKICTFSRLKT